MTDENGAKPQFDLTRAGRKWGRAWQRVQTEFSEANATITAMRVDGEDTLTDEQQIEAARLMRLVDDAAERQDALVQEVLVSIPAGWVVPGSDPGLVDNVQDARYADLVAALEQARADDAKN